MSSSCSAKTSIIIKYVSIILFSFLLSACNSGSEDASLHSEDASLQEIAFNKIADYAETATNPTPTVQDYIDAGVSGVTSENLAELNILVEQLEPDDVDTEAEVTALMAQFNLQIASKANWGFQWDGVSVWQ